jgi:hypothetical protein
VVNERNVRFNCRLCAVALCDGVRVNRFEVLNFKQPSELWIELSKL